MWKLPQKISILRHKLIDPKIIWFRIIFFVGLQKLVNILNFSLPFIQSIFQFPELNCVMSKGKESRGPNYRDADHGQIITQWLGNNMCKTSSSQWLHYASNVNNSVGFGENDNRKPNQLNKGKNCNCKRPVSGSEPLSEFYFATEFHCVIVKDDDVITNECYKPKNHLKGHSPQPSIRYSNMSSVVVFGYGEDVWMCKILYLSAIWVLRAVVARSPETPLNFCHPFKIPNAQIQSIERSFEQTVGWKYW